MANRITKAAPKSPRKPTLKTADSRDQQVATSLEKARASGRWLVAVFRVADGQVHLDRHSHQFPRGDFDTALSLLTEDLRAERSTP